MRLNSSIWNLLSLKMKELYWTTTRAIGLSALHDGRVLRSHLNTFLGLIFYPIYFAAAQILKPLNVRFIDARYNGEPYGIIEHVGHCAMDFDTYLKIRRLSHRHVVPIFLCGGRKPANAALIAHWSRYICFIDNIALDILLRPLMSFRGIVDSTVGYTTVMGGAARIYEVQAQWGARPPLLCLSDAEIERGEAQLRLLGVPEGNWFVCVHSREGGYIPGSEWQHSFRNSNITDYTQAMQAIVARGGWCIRVGDPTMRPLEPMRGVVDYALSQWKTDWMDVFLGARCRFFLGNTSGLFGLSAIFGRPSALANMAPFGCAYSPYPGDISIPKLLRDSQGQIIPFEQVFADETSEYRYTSQFEKRGFQHVNNSPLDIAEMAIEMMDRIDGLLENANDDLVLQTKFLSLVGPRHYSWGASSYIGRAFLRRYRSLLTDCDHAFDSTAAD